MLQLIKFPLHLTHLAALCSKLQVIAQDLVWGDVSQLVRVLANKCRIIMITISQVRLMAQNSQVSTSSPRSSPR